MQIKGEHAGLGRKLDGRSSQTVTARDVVLELGIVVHPYDPSTQEDQMFKAILGLEKREKNKNIEEKIRDVERTGFYFVFVPPPIFFHSHM